MTWVRFGGPLFLKETIIKTLGRVVSGSDFHKLLQCRGLRLQTGLLESTCFSCSRSRRISQAFPHPESSIEKCPAGVEPAHPPWQSGRLPLHHGHTSLSPNCQRDREHRVGLEPT